MDTERVEKAEYRGRDVNELRRQVAEAIGPHCNGRREAEALLGVLGYRFEAGEMVVRCTAAEWAAALDSPAVLAAHAHRVIHGKPKLPREQKRSKELAVYLTPAEAAALRAVAAEARMAPAVWARQVVMGAVTSRTNAALDGTLRAADMLDSASAPPSQSPPSQSI